MIARKDSDIWTAISAFGLPYPPFDYNSGMDLQDIDRDEAVQLGVIESDDTIEPQERDFNEDMQAGLHGMEPALQQAMLKQLGPGYEIDEDGILRRK